VSWAAKGDSTVEGDPSLVAGDFWFGNVDGGAELGIVGMNWRQLGGFVHGDNMSRHLAFRNVGNRETTTR